MQQPEPLDGALPSRRHSSRQLQEHGLNLGVDRFGRRLARDGDRLDGLTLGDHGQELFLGREQAARRDDRLEQRLDDARVQSPYRRSPPS